LAQRRANWTVAVWVLDIVDSVVARDGFAAHPINMLRYRATVNTIDERFLSGSCSHGRICTKPDLPVDQEAVQAPSLRGDIKRRRERHRLAPIPSPHRPPVFVVRWATAERLHHAHGFRAAVDPVGGHARSNGGREGDGFEGNGHGNPRIAASNSAAFRHDSPEQPLLSRCSCFFSR